MSRVRAFSTRLRARCTAALVCQHVRSFPDPNPFVPAYLASSELGRQLEAFGVQFRIDSIYQRIDSEQFMTEQQWNVLSTALELGYYDIPRTCTQYELAEAVGVANSTCSETLHRAEEQVIKRFMDAATEPTSPILVP